MQDGQLQTQVKAEPRDDDDLFGGSDSSPGPQPTQGQDPMEMENLAAPPPKQVDVRDLFPSFEYGKTLEFTDLFGMRPRKKRRVAKEGIKRVLTFLSRFADVSTTYPALPFTVALPSTTELSRPKSTRDSLLAPLRPLPPPAKGDELVKLMLREARAEGMRESGVAVGDEEESEGEELRKAVEVNSEFLRLDHSSIPRLTEKNLSRLLPASFATDQDGLADTGR
jgi:transcription initiation factor TFIID subunit 1